MQRTRALFLLAALGIALLTGCAAQPRVAVIQDPDASFTRYRSFAFMDPLGTDRAGGTATVLSATLKELARSELEARGYRFDPAQADLLVNFFVESREVVRGRSGPSVGVGYGIYHRHYGVWSGYETEIRQYTESTLHMDVVDTERDQLVWEAIATQRLTEHDLAFEPETVRASMQRVLARFPSAAIGPGAPPG